MNTAVRALSGGMKRKLSLGIALIGNSKVVQNFNGTILLLSHVGMNRKVLLFPFSGYNFG